MARIHKIALAFLPIFLLFSHINAHAVTLEFPGNPYNLAIVLNPSQSGYAAGETRLLYSFWLNPGEIPKLDIQGQSAILNVIGNVRVASYTNGKWQYFENGKGQFTATYDDVSDLGNGTYLGGDLGFAAFSYSSASQDVDISLSLNPTNEVAGYQGAHSFYLGNDIHTSIGGHTFDFLSRFTVSGLLIDGQTTSNFTGGYGGAVLSYANPSSAVPEPSSIALFSLGIIGGALRKKKLT